MVVPAWGDNKVCRKKKKIPYLHQCPLSYPLSGYPLGEVEHQLEVALPWPDSPTSEALQEPIEWNRWVQWMQLGFWQRSNVAHAPSHQFLEVIVAPNINIVEEDLRNGAASCQLLHPGSELWMPPYIHITYWHTHTPQGVLSLHTVRAALDGVHCYSA